MGQEELIAALRRDGETKARQIWREVEQQAERLRTETAQSLDRQQQVVQERRQKEASTLLEEALVLAHRRAQQCRLETENRLAQRLRNLAEGLLPELADTGGEQLFRQLSREIPNEPWQKVKVAPRDEPVARSCYPKAEITLQESISAGLEVVGDEGRISIINTLEKRLEHLWQHLLPDLLRDLRERAADETAA